jgi:hypothetical protein
MSWARRSGWWAGAILLGVAACSGAALYDPGARISRVPFNRLIDGEAVPDEIIYLHSRRGCRLSEDGVERYPADAVPAGAIPCPSCLRP